MVGPSWASSTCRSRATSSASGDIGDWGAVAGYPAAGSRWMTALQLEPSAHAPWTRTMFGWVLISVIPFRVYAQVTPWRLSLSPSRTVPGDGTRAHPTVVGYLCAGVPAAREY